MKNSLNIQLFIWKQFDKIEVFIAISVLFNSNLVDLQCKLINMK